MIILKPFYWFRHMYIFINLLCLFNIEVVLKFRPDPRMAVAFYPDDISVVVFFSGVPFFEAVFDELGCQVKWNFSEGSTLKPVCHVATVTGRVCVGHLKDSELVQGLG